MDSETAQEEGAATSEDVQVDEIKTVVFSKKSNLTLVSSDGVHFSVSFAMMSEASSVFDEMFSLPQPRSSSPSNTEPPKIHLEENSSTLDLFLSWIYPTNKRPPLETFGDVSRLLVVAKKYDVTVDLLRSMLTRPSFLSSEPLRLYAFCLRNNFAQEGTAAALELIRTNTNIWEIAFTPEIENVLDGVSFSDMKRLDLVRRKAVNDANSLLLRTLQVTIPSTGGCSYCWKTTLPWVNHFIEQIQSPFNPSISDQTFIQQSVERYYHPNPIPSRFHHTIACASARLKRVEPEICAILVEASRFLFKREEHVPSEPVQAAERRVST